MAFKGIIPAGSYKPAPFGLFSVADVVERGPRDEHWGQGFEAESELCNYDASLVDVCAAVDPIELFQSETQRWQSIRPFGIVVADRCTTVGWNVDDRKARVIRQLENVTERGVERELFDGVYRREWEDSEGVDPAEGSGYLTGPNAEVPTGADTAHKALVTLAIVEQGLADSGLDVQGVIHMLPMVASVLTGWLQEEDGHLYTLAGNLVSVGSGYTTSGPYASGSSNDGSLTTSWIYGTGPVNVVLGSKELITVTEAQATDTRTNDMVYVAERPAAVYVDGCAIVAAKVDITL